MSNEEFDNSRTSVGGVFDTRFASLEDASRKLSMNVSALNETLKIVAELQRQQREQSERQAKTEQALEAAKIVGDQREQRTKRVMGLTVVVLAILLPVVSILVYASLIAHVDDLLNQQKRDRYQSCEIRNSATMVEVTRERQLAALEPDAKLKQIHADSANQLQTSVVNCTQYQVKK